MRPDIESIQARVYAASAGPWEVEEESRHRYLEFPFKCDLCEEGIDLLGIRVLDNGAKTHVHWAPSHCIQVHNGPLVAGNFDYEEGGIIRHEDTVFIANARQDVPELLEYIAELEAELDKIKEN